MGVVVTHRAPPPPVATKHQGMQTEEGREGEERRREGEECLEVGVQTTLM